LAVTYPHAATLTITDDNGNNWTGTLVVTADAGVGNTVSQYYVLPNANAGMTTIFMTFGSSLQPFEYTIDEVCNVATVSPVNGSHGTAAVSGSSLATGAFTPGNNDANGGNLILSYFGSAVTSTSAPTKWTAGGSATLLDADIAWISRSSINHASQRFLQTVSASINPGVTTTGDNGGNQYNCIAVALKAANVGSDYPAGIRVRKINTFTSDLPPSSTWTFQCPASGNLRVILTADPDSLAHITSIVDSEGGTMANGAWVLKNNGGPQIFYSANTSPNQDLTVTFNGSFTATASFRFFDIEGAAASPFDVSAGVVDTDVSNTTTIANFPTITPTTSNGLVIAVGGLGQGPGLGFSSGAPAAALWDLTTYPPEELDTDLMENADLCGHYYNPDLSAIHWNWTFTSNPSNSASVTAVTFKSA